MNKNRWQKLIVTTLAAGTMFSMAPVATAQQGADQDQSRTQSRQVEAQRSQSQSQQHRMQSQRQSQMQMQLQEASKLIGKDVKSPQGEKLGDIDDIVLTSDGNRIAYAVLASGGFLGLGQKLYAVPWESFQGLGQEGEAILNISKDDLGRAEGFDKNNWPDVADQRWQARNDQAFGARVQTGEYRQEGRDTSQWRGGATDTRSLRTDRQSDWDPQVSDYDDRERQQAMSRDRSRTEIDREQRVGIERDYDRGEYRAERRDSDSRWFNPDARDPRSTNLGNQPRERAMATQDDSYKRSAPADRSRRDLSDGGDYTDFRATDLGNEPRQRVRSAHDDRDFARRSDRDVEYRSDRDVEYRSDRGVEHRSDREFSRTEGTWSYEGEGRYRQASGTESSDPNRLRDENVYHYDWDAEESRDRSLMRRGSTAQETFWTRRLSDLIGLEARAEGNREIGELEDILVDIREGRAAFAILSLGGLDDIRHDTTIVPWQLIEVQPQERLAQINARTDVLVQNAYERDRRPNLSDMAIVQNIHRSYNTESTVYGYAPAESGSNQQATSGSRTSGRSMYSQQFNPRNVQTITGSVESVGSFNLNTTEEPGRRLLIKTQDGQTHTVIAGPTSWYDRQGVSLRPGDKVTIKGSPANINDRQVFLAGAITTGEESEQRTLQLYDDEGRPQWDAEREQQPRQGTDQRMNRQAPAGQQNQQRDAGQLNQPDNQRNQRDTRQQNQPRSPQVNQPDVNQ